MPAKLVIISGLSSGAELWVEEMVSRIGSDPHCQLCVADAGLAAHAATLEFRAGDYLLHNRTDAPVVLAGREVPCRGSARWPAGQTLQITEALALRLEISGDPAPSPRPPAGHADLVESAPAEEEPAESVEEPAAPRPGKAGPLAVTLACVVLGALLLLMDSTEEETPISNVPREFEALIAELGEQKQLPGREADELRAALQAARIAELRGGKRQSQHYYGYLRDLLLARRRPDGSFATGVEGKAWEFVEGQLRSPVGPEKPADGPQKMT